MMVAILVALLLGNYEGNGEDDNRILLILCPLFGKIQTFSDSI